MDKKTLMLAAAGLLLVGLASSNFLDAKNGAETEPAPAVATAPAPAPGDAVEDGTYAVSADSTVGWEGRKPLIANYADVGTLAIKEGSVRFEGGKAVEGKFVFDMQGLKVGATGKQKGESMLEKHLKSKDFFNVEEHATAEFVLKEAAAQGPAEARGYVVRGDLTIKGITNAIEFPALIYAKDGLVHAKGTAVLDRTLWDIRYGSGKFFQDLGDKIIDDNFTVTLDVTGSAAE